MPDNLHSQTALGQTIEARIAELLTDPDAALLVRTLVERPGTTLRPKSEPGGQAPSTALPEASNRGDGAVLALQSLGASLEGKIELHQTLGEGGMGIVHLATQATVGRHVAVKTLREGVRAPEAARSMLREAWVTGTLEHPNVVPIYDVGVDATGAPIIVMKRIEGQQWAELIHDPDAVAKRFPTVDPVEWNLDILGDVCNAIHFAHSRGILHRDLKPENVMIGSFGEVYLLDWGIAVSLADDPTGRLPLAASATDVAGTPNYMAPEMLLGDPSKLSVRTDVYLLGAVLYEIFAGHPPHEGEDLRAMVTHILSSPISFPDDVPSEIVEICTRAMSREASGRYESAEAFRQAIEEYVRHRGSQRLAADARQSHAMLALSLASAGDATHAQAIPRLLGECRFGYRAALTAWPDNPDARIGHDEALLAVIEHSLEKGDARAGEALLRELLVAPPELVGRVEAAAKAHREHDARLHRLEADHDATVGTRTRTFLATTFGALWTITPLLGWFYVAHYGTEPRYFPILLPVAFVVIGGLSFFWARETLLKTLFNRQVIATAMLYFIAQLLLAVFGQVAGLRSYHIHLISIFGWAVTHALLAVWAERWFGVVAATCAASFILGSLFPSLILPLMSLDNLVFTVVAIRAWLPRGDIQRVRDESRRILKAHRAG